MDNHLLNALKNYITPDLVTQASEVLDETESNIFKAISATIPTLVFSLFDKTTHPQTIDQFIGLANSTSLNASEIMSDLPTLLTDKGNTSLLDSGKQALDLLFKDKQSRLFEILADKLHIKTSSIFRLMMMSTLMVLAYVKSKELNSSELINSLTAQRDDILLETPSGIKALLNDTNTVVTTEKKTRPIQTKKKHKEGIKHRWIIPILILIVAILFLIVIK
ncbi:DUF937 domain-containing protein [Formosa sediminum]|uniref:DUF937 domain-containing protein n=1 Tax=Formosa sediminum TaxID=2594004 RepID=A0A516GS88_9FLAO|nr:DUF937 domain-containing protein [Formosa sediminum]QDO94384.1 DUF937 domain-containing protein [Formosa sediminum]